MAKFVIFFGTRAGTGQRSNSQSLRSSGKLSIEERRKATEPRPKVKRTPHSLTWYSQPHSPPAVRPSYGGTCRR